MFKKESKIDILEAPNDPATDSFMALNKTAPFPQDK